MYSHLFQNYKRYRQYSLAFIFFTCNYLNFVLFIRIYWILFKNVKIKILAFSSLKFLQHPKNLYEGSLLLKKVQENLIFIVKFKGSYTRVCFLKIQSCKFGTYRSYRKIFLSFLTNTSIYCKLYFRYIYKFTKIKKDNFR